MGCLEHILRSSKHFPALLWYFIPTSMTSGMSRFLKTADRWKVIRSQSLGLLTALFNWCVYQLFVLLPFLDFQSLILFLFQKIQEVMKTSSWKMMMIVIMAVRRRKIKRSPRNPSQRGKKRRCLSPG